MLPGPHTTVVMLSMLLNRPPSVPKLILVSKLWLCANCRIKATIWVFSGVCRPGYSDNTRVSISQSANLACISSRNSCMKALNSCNRVCGFSSAILRISNRSWHWLGTMFNAVPPLMVPVCTVVKGGEKVSWKGPFSCLSKARFSNQLTILAA